MLDLRGQVETAIAEQRLFRPRESILVAVSGGVDSMVLLELLDQLVVKRGCRLAVAHLNHGLRGQSSDADERLVRRTAKAKKLPFISERVDVSAAAEQGRVSTEMAARKLRHQFLVRAAREFGTRKIALAHHADDQVELFLLRLLRGSGMDGLAGMKWRSPSPESSKFTVTRPLLGISRREIEAFAREERISFRHDASNDSLDILRNRIRHELLPLIEKQYQPGFRKVALRLMDLLGAETQFSSAIIGELLAGGSAQFDKLPVAAQRRLLQLQLIRLGLRHDYQTVELLRSQPDRPVSLAAEVSAFRDPSGRVHEKGVQQIQFNRRQKLVDLHGTGTTQFDGVRFDWKTSKAMANSRKRTASRREWFDADRVGSRVVLRHWQPGDRFQPIGMGATVKLQDFFANAKVSRAVRHKLTVATTAQGEIFWIENMRISERFKLDASTRRRLEWSWHRPEGRLQRGSKDANLQR